MKNNSYDKKIFRLLYILNKLNSGSPVRTLDLASEFNVTTRTVQRDIMLLSTVGFPLVSDESGHRFMKEFGLRKIVVTPEEKLLLELFYKLFSRTGEPFSSATKSLLDKIFISSNRNLDDSGSSFYEKKSLIEQKVGEFSKSLAIDLQKIPDSTAVRKAIEEFKTNLKNRVKLLKKNKKSHIKFSFLRNFKKPNLICSVIVPKSYFSDPYRHLYFSHREDYFVFEFFVTHPNKLNQRLQIEAHLAINYRFFGPFIKPNKIACFDNLMTSLGFSNKEKVANYEFSYGNEKLLITRMLIAWYKDIPLAKEEIKPFLKNKMLIWKPGKLKATLL
jgi:hypothetical protein